MRKKALYVGGGVAFVFLAIAFYSLLSADTMNFGSNSNQAFECGSTNYSDTSCGTSRNAICNLDLCGWTNRFAITWDDFDDGRGIGIEGFDITGGDVTGAGTQGRFSFFSKENGETSMGWAYTERNWDWDTYTASLNKMCNASLKFDYSVYSTDWDEAGLNSQLDAFVVPQDKTSGGLRYSCMPDRATYYTGSQCGQGTWGPINNDFGTGNVCCGIANGMAIRFEGWVYVASGGTYRFRVGGDDGVRLTVNGSWVAGNYTNQGYTTYMSGNVTLTAGYNPVMFEYYEDGSGARVTLEWCSGASCTSWAVIPAASLYYSNWYKLKGPERETTDDAYYYGGTPPNSGHIHIEDPSNAGNNPNLSYNDESITAIYPCNKGGDCTAIKLAKFFNDYGTTSKEHFLRFWMSAKNPSSGGNANWLKWSVDDARVDYTIDTTAPTCSWTGSGFGTYDTDGIASATTSCSDAECGLRVNSEYGDGEAIQIGRKVNDVWSYYCADATWQSDADCPSNGGPGWQTNGTVCSISGGLDSKYIQCAVRARDKAYSANVSGWSYTTNTLVDLNIPLSSQPTVDNPYFSPNNSASVKDTATTSMSPTDSASGIGCYQMEVKDSTGATHVRWHTTGSCTGTANYSAWASNPTTWAWDGKDDASAFVAEGTYRVYVNTKDNAGWPSAASGATEIQTCSTETLTTGVSVGGNCASTSTNNAVYRQVDEADVAAVENEIAVSAQNSYGTVNSGTYVSTQVQDSVDWNWNEGCGWCGINPSACYLDFNMTYNSDVPEGTITALKLQTRYKTEDDNFELYWYNYDTSSWSDRATGVPASQSAYATFNYTLCSGAGNCNPWVSSSGDVRMDWFDEENCGVENSDYYKVDYQHVEVDYNQRKMDVSYEFVTAQTLASISSVVLKTDAYSGNEAFQIYKWNYSGGGSWENTGYTTPSTEPVSPQTITLCNSNCSTYVTDAGADRRFKIRYVDPTAKDGTVNRLSIDYQVADVNWGANWLQTVVDNTNPATSDDWTDNWTGASPVTVNLAPTDALAGIEYTKYCVDTANSCDPTTGTTGTNVSVTCAAGSVCTQYVRYQSRDNAGNSDSVVSKRVRQDMQNPTTTDDWTDNWTNTSPVNITLTPSDGTGSGVQATYYCVDTLNNCTPSTSGISVSVTCAAGSTCTQYVRYYTKDNVNNSESVNSKQVRQDRIVPATFGTVTPANTATATHVDGTFDFSVTFTEADSIPPTCQYCKSTDGVCDSEWAAGAVSGTAPNYTCTITGTTCTDGQSLTLSMRATDVAANVGTAASVTRTCDTVAPSFTLTSWDTGCAGTQYTNNESYGDSTPTFCYAATDARAGLHATTPYTYVFGTDCAAAPSTNTTLSSYGATIATNATKNCFRVYARDAVDNVSATSTFTYMYNTVAPSWRYPGVGSAVGPFYGGGTIRTYGAEQRYYVASNGGVMYAVNAADGTEKWQCELDISPDNGGIPNCGAGDYGPVVSPPLVFGGKIYLGTYYGYVLRFTDNGAGWTLDAERDLGVCSIQSATLTITLSGATKILVGCADSMYALNDDATFTNWANWTTNPRPLTGSVTRSIPAYAVLPGGADPYLYAATQNGTLADGSYGNLYKIDINNGSILNTFGDSTDFTGFLVLRNYFGDGNQWLYAGGANSNKFYAIKTSSVPATCTGASCVSFAASSGFEGGAAVSSGGSVVYAGNNNGTLYRLNFNGTTLTSPYNFDAGGATNAIKYGITFRQATGRLYFGTDSGLFFIISDPGGAGPFSEIMKYHTGASVSATPAVNATAVKVVVPSTIGRIFSFGL